MANINRDYLVVLDVKTGNATAPNMYFYNTDKSTSNIYVQLVVKETVVKATPIENATDFVIVAKIIKPGKVFKEMTGVLVNIEEAIYEFDLPTDFTNLSGNYDVEFWVSAKVSDSNETITSSNIMYTVKQSILTELDPSIDDTNDYPLLIALKEELESLKNSGQISHSHENKSVLDGITSTKVTNWDTAYTHSQSLHFSGNYNDLTNKPAIPTKTSDLTNDNGFATETFVTNKIAEAALSGGEVDLSGYVTKETGNADQITFADGQTFQAKLDNGTLKGEKGDKGDKGDKGEQGPQGPAGADGLTTSISLNGVTYTQENGVITLPNITSGGNTPTITQIEPQELDMPKVFFYGNALPTTKDNVNLTMDYVSNTDKFTSYVKLKCQGTSSMSYAKKNFTVTMYSDEARATTLKKDFKGWGAQSKFCLKANYVDTTHTRNLSGARIAYDMVKSRPDSPFKQQLLQCPRNGAVDGFPIKLYFNGEFYGIYTWNIPKDGWMFNMDKSNPNHVVLCAERNTDGNASLSNSCQFKKLWTDGDGGDWSVEFGTYSTDLQTKFNRVIAFVKDSTDEEFKANISQYLDLYSVIDYYCFSYLCCHLDGLAKNMLMVTYDGNIWGCSLYDMDSIFGVNWNGQSYVASNYQCPEQYQEQFSLLWPKIERCFGNELYQRYLELRQGALSLSNIVKHVEEIYDVIPDRVFADEKAKWTSLPQVNTNTITRFRNYMRDRAVYVDAEMKAIGTTIPCTGIVLSADTLSFTTTDTQTLSVVVSPTNCTDTVTWSVSPTGIVSIDNGVVTPIANGTCTITATCGSYSDTCSVTVSGMSESGGDTDPTLLYQLPEETVFNGTSTYIDTGVALLSTDQDFTIVLDVTAHESQNNSQATMFHCMHEEAPYPGLSCMTSSGDNGFYIPTGNNVTTIGQRPYLIPKSLRTKVVIIKEGTTLSAYNNKGFAGSSTYTYSQVNENLLIGAYQTTSGVKGRYFLGTVHDFKIYNKAFTSQEKDAYLGISSGGRVFKIDSTCMNTASNTLIDSVTGISATLTGNPTVSNNQIAFTESDTFSFDITSLNLITSNRTLRIKFTPTTLDTNSRNVIGLGSGATDWGNMTTCYVYSTKLVLQHGSNSFSNNTTGGVSGNHSSNRLSTTPVTGQEYELVISENTDGSTRWYIDGILVQNGITTPFNPLYLSNVEGNTRFIGNYSLIEIYNEYCETYEDFTNMINNTSGDILSTAEYALTKATTFNGTSDYIDTGIQLFDTAKDFAVYIDFTPTDGASQSNQAVVFHCLHEVSPYRGLTLMIKQGGSVPYMIGGQASSNPYLDDIGDGNHRYLIQFTNGTISSIKTIDESNNIVNCTLNTTARDNPYVQVTENLLLGCYQESNGNKGRFWNGTINKFAVWFKQLTNDEINEIISM